MEIRIIIKDKQVRILLEDGNKTLDSQDFLEDHNLSQTLLTNIAELLKRNKKTASEIVYVQADSDLGDSFTSTRIAKSIANAFSWGVKKKL